MKTLILLFILALVNTSCGQTPENERKTDVLVGHPCEGCEAIYESPIEFENLDYTDTLPDFDEEGPKIVISGTVYQKDGTTPAPGVVLYLYHTDRDGYYPKKGDEKGWGQRHGYIRGWLKTNDKGEYRFYTFRPAPYPNNTEPAHIHMILKEPDLNEYYIDDFVFSDDPFVDEDYRKRVRDKGGSGILTLKEQNGIYTAIRDIILGKNISNYPEN